MKPFVASAPFLPLETWITIVDGNDEARALFDRHYSRKRYKDGREPKLFVGPGSKLVLTTPDRKAIFVWRKFISGDGQTGINCAIFRNEGKARSSVLLAEAEAIAERRWPGERRYTYVNPKSVKSGVPGWCFIQAGWQPCGITKWNKLIIFERCPECQSTSHRKSTARTLTLMGNIGSTRPSSFTSSLTSVETATELSTRTELPTGLNAVGSVSRGSLALVKRPLSHSKRDTHRMAETACPAPFMGGAVANGDAPEPSTQTHTTKKKGE